MYISEWKSNVDGYEAVLSFLEGYTPFIKLLVAKSDGNEWKPLVKDINTNLTLATTGSKLYLEDAKLEAKSLAHEYIIFAANDCGNIEL